MAPIDQHPVVTQISRLVAARAEEWFGAGATVSRSPSVDERTWSYLMRYDVLRPGQAGTRVVAKVPREPGIETLDAAVAAEHWHRATRLEFETLQGVAAVMAQHRPEGLCAIRALAYLPDCNALVMEELPSRTLKSRLLDRRTVVGRSPQWRRTEELLARAGRWLRLFHDELGEPAQEPFPVDRTRTDVRDELSRLAAAIGTGAGLHALSAELDRAVTALQGADVPTSTLHGDYNCVNVLVGPGDCVGALDMNEAVRGPVYADLATIMTDLLTRKAFVLVFGPTLRTRRTRRCADAVLTGYFGAEPHDPRALHLACARAVLGKWRLDEEAAEQSSTWRRPLEAPLRLTFRRYYRQLALGYLRTRAGAVAGAPGRGTAEHA